MTYVLDTKKIRVVDGTLAAIAGWRAINLTPSLTLKFVLHVPKLSINLFYTHQITKDLNKDQIIGRMIGQAREQKGFYFLETSSGNGDMVPHSHLSTISSPKKDQIWLHHFHLGHPPFSLLKKMFPSLFTHLDVNNFHYETCELAKHHRMSFLLSNKMSSTPFSLIHTHVWEPSRIPNILGHNGLCPLLMIILEWLDFSFGKINLMWAMCFLFFTKWLATNLGSKLKLFDNGRE